MAKVKQCYLDRASSQSYVHLVFAPAPPLRAPLCGVSRKVGQQGLFPSTAHKAKEGRGVSSLLSGQLLEMPPRHLPVCLRVETMFQVEGEVNRS